MRSVSKFFNGRFIDINPPKLIKEISYTRIFLKESAEKHFWRCTEEIVKHILGTIKDENLSNEYQNEGYLPNFQVASQTIDSPVPNPKMNTQFRNMSYRLHPDKCIIEIFHLSPWQKDQYEKCPSDMKSGSSLELIF